MTSIRFALIFALFLLGPLASQLSYSQESAGLVELSCANFPRDVTEADLKTRFGEENVVSEPLVGADDGPQDGTVIFPDDDSMRLELFWWDPD